MMIMGMPMMLFNLEVGVRIVKGSAVCQTIHSGRYYQKTEERALSSLRKFSNPFVFVIKFNMFNQLSKIPQAQ